MKRKLNNASLTIGKYKKKQFSTLVKALRPRVFIIDSSSFKTLVQEQTGNGSSSNTLSTPVTRQKLEEEIHVIDIGHKKLEQESSISSSREISGDAAIDGDSWNQLVLNEQMNQSWDQIYMDVTSTMNQEMGSLGCQDLESWLLDFRPCCPRQWTLD